ncbi:MAG: hypothetical protein HZA28_05250 [Candidatus Omnitrophica bacterium]|nr:hypothetical protein [Candidatus Omnitrophota bacterium]
MPEISVKDQVKRLVDLQKLDGEIYRFKVELIEKPALIEELRKKFEASKSHLLKLEEKLKGVQLKRKELELDLKAKEDNIIKANGQLSQIKTNKEYQAKLTEIASIKADKSIIEEKILLSYDETDTVQAEVAKEEIVVDGAEKQYLTQKKQVEEEMMLIQDRVKVLDSQRKQLLPGVDKVSLQRYEKVLAHKNGLAIVPVKDSSCGGCYMNVNPQTINAIKMHDQFVVCEICQRILYIEDDL